jgi:hypothetical protein
MQDLSPVEQIFDIHKLTISETGWAAWDWHDVHRSVMEGSSLGSIDGARWSTHVSNYLLLPKGKEMEWIRRDDPPLEIQLLQRRWRGSECWNVLLMMKLHTFRKDRRDFCTREYINVTRWFVQ